MKDVRTGHPTATTTTSGRRGARQSSLLDNLSEEHLDELLPPPLETELVVGQVLQEPGYPVQRVHVPLSGVISVLVQQQPDGAVEVATTGRESVLGLAALLGIIYSRGAVEVVDRGRLQAAPAAAAPPSAAPQPLPPSHRRHREGGPPATPSGRTRFAPCS